MTVAMVVGLALFGAVPVCLHRFDPTHAIAAFGDFRWLAVRPGMALGIGLLARHAPPSRPPG